MSEYLEEIIELRRQQAADEDESASETKPPEGQKPDESDDESESTPDPQYEDEYEFMVEFVGPMISRKISTKAGDGLRWDPNWFQYPEALWRAEIMWRTFEAARADIDPTGLEVWARQVLDYHLGVLMNGSTGPMRDTGPREGIGANYPADHSKAEAHNQLMIARKEAKEHRRKQILNDNQQEGK